MSTTLTFVDKKLLDSSLIDENGAAHYTMSTTKGFLGPKITTITGAGGIVGLIDWRQRIFAIDGVKREWKYLKSRSGGIFSSLKYHNSQKELLATSSAIGTVRFTTYRSHIFHDNKPATLHFPSQLQDETERMFLIMAILQTEIRRQEREQSSRNAAAANSAAAASASSAGPSC
ncbi:hypothetical protein C8R43DRAFT_1229406 [Mycena crocata]|nr:hypothetical protein C8R43DRAFT_1229406 [Mycena crocata]